MAEPFESQKIGGLTGNELRWGYWYVTHRDAVIRGVTIGLLAVAIGLWGYTLYGLFRYFVWDWSRFQQAMVALTSQPIDYRAWHDSHQPTPLAFSPVSMIGLGNDRYDFFAAVENKNSTWTVQQLTYAFVVPGTTAVAEQVTFVLPNSKKYLTDLGTTVSGLPTGVRLSVSAIRWQRVRQYEQLAADRGAVRVSDITFVPPDTSSSGKLPISKTRFTVTNNTAYSFWQNPFTVALFQGPRIIGITRVTQDGLDSQEQRTIEVNWYQRLVTPTNIEVLSDVDILNPSVFRPLRAEYTEPR